MIEFVQNIYLKYIPAKFQKRIEKYFPGYRADDLAHADGRKDR